MPRRSNDFVTIFQLASTSTQKTFQQPASIKVLSIGITWITTQQMTQPHKITKKFAQASNPALPLITQIIQKSPMDFFLELKLFPSSHPGYAMHAQALEISAPVLNLKIE
jgi:hypothetical protein